MTSDAPIAIDVDSQSAPAATDASPAPLEPPSSHTALTSHYHQPRKRDMDNSDHTRGVDGQVQQPASGSFGQFSFAPATQTTVVTTTTTTTTNFPPLLIKPPRATKDLDPKLYPLASSSTPDSLRNVKFDLGGKPVVFNEPEDTTNAINEVCRVIFASRCYSFFHICPGYRSVPVVNVICRHRRRTMP